jgi:predicted NBD/HSP70 family sugar kinase
MKATEILRPTTVRGANSAVVLRLLRRFGSMSRADLARHSGLSEGSVSRITSELISDQWVCEDGAENSTGGRPGTRLRLDEKRIGLGVDIRRNECRLAATTPAGKILEVAGFPTSQSPDETLAQIAQAVRVLRNNCGKAPIEGLGVSARGIVNSHTGVVEFGSSPAWVGVHVKERLQAALKMPVQLDNNVRLAAIAEYNYGNLLEVRNSRCLLLVVIDEGIGVGIVLDGKLYYGPNDAAGEFGQMVIADNNDSERVDRPGCLEQLASSVALSDRYAALTNGRPLPPSGDSRARVRKICQGAMSGEKAAVDALTQTCRFLGIGITNVVWGLNADAVVLDAPLNDAWSLVAPQIRAQFPPGDDLVTFRNLVLRPSSLGGEASIIGAATLPFQSIFTSGDGGRETKSTRATRDSV